MPMGGVEGPRGLGQLSVYLIVSFVGRLHMHVSQSLKWLHMAVCIITGFDSGLAYSGAVVGPKVLAPIFRPHSRHK